MTQLVFAFLFLAFFIAIAYTGELNGYLTRQWTRFKSFTIWEWALGLVLLVGTATLSHYITEHLTPVVPALAKSQANAVAQNGGHHENLLHHIAGFIVALGCITTINGIATVIEEWYGEEWAWLGIARNLLICLLLEWMTDTCLSFLVWYLVQTIGSSLVFGLSWLVRRKVGDENARQRAATITGNSVAVQFLLMFGMIALAEFLIAVVL